MSLESRKEENKQKIFEDLAEEKEVYFLNLAPELKTTENELNSIYDAGDGLHFKQETYDVILQYIKTHQVPE